MENQLLRKEFDKQFSDDFESQVEKGIEQDKLFLVLVKRVYMETMELLGEDDRNEYRRMIEEGAENEKVENFLNERIENYPQFLEEIMAQFREEMTFLKNK